MALTLFCLLLLGHVLFERLVLLCQLHILLHGLIEQLKFAVKVRSSLRAQAGLLRRTGHLLIVYRQICDNLLDALLLNGCVVGLWGERLSSLGLLRLENGTLSAGFLLCFQVPRP